MARNNTSGLMEEETFVDLGKAIWKRRKWTGLLAFAFVLGMGLSLVSAVPNLYRAQATVLIEQNEVSESIVESSAAEELEQRLQIIKQAIWSRSGLWQVIDRFDLYSELRRKADEDTVVDRMRKDLQVRDKEVRERWGDRSTIAFTLAFQDWSSEVAAQVANHVASLYVEENRTMLERQAAATTEFLKERLERAQAELEVQDVLINSYHDRFAGELPEQQDLNFATLKRLTDELRINTEKQVRFMERQDELAESTGEIASYSISGESEVQLESLKHQYAALRDRYSDKYPDVVRLKRRIADLESGESGESGESEKEQGPGDGVNPDAKAPNELELLRQEEQRIRHRIADLERSIEIGPARARELNQLTRNYDVIKENYFDLMNRYQEAQLTQTLEQAQAQRIRILEAAIPPAQPSEPKRLRLAFMFLVLAFGTAGAVIFLVEQMDTSFHSVGELSAFSRLPILATIPRIETPGDKRRRWWRSFLYSVTSMVGFIVAVILAWYAGYGNERFVWMVAGGL